MKSFIGPPLQFHCPIKFLIVVLTLTLVGCNPLAPVVPLRVESPSAITSTEPLQTPTSTPTIAPPIVTPAPKKIRLSVVESLTTVRTRCWKSVLGDQYLPRCGAVYSVTVRASARTEGTVVIDWTAKLSTYDSCCGDRTLNTYFREMKQPKPVLGSPELSLIGKWDGYPVEKSPSIDNYFIPTGVTSGTFAYWSLDQGEEEAVTFSLVFDNGGGGYMSFPYPLKVTILGDDVKLVSFTQDRLDK